MNIHEYQAKALLEKFGVAVPKGVAARSVAEFEPALVQFPDGPVVVKAQLHAGGRGKGTFTDGFKGGVKIAQTKAEALDYAKRMFGNTLVTLQTGPAGRKVQTIYFTVPCQIEKEYYLAILLDRATSRPVIVASTEGGVEIEAVAANTPEKIFKIHVDPAVGLQPFQARQLAFQLGLTGDYFKNAVKLINSLYRAWWESDATMVEINPLIATPGGGILALDAKVALDDNALFRHPEL